MVYDRTIDDRELSFEASGALWEASLVMRDRETDSWWSIMTAAAIGGELEGTGLTELPVGEKTTWQDWVSRHPDTVVLSVDGVEHLDNNPYEEYFASERTFRGLEISDKRLDPKTAIFSFRLGDRPYAAPHRAFEGGRVFLLDAGEDERALFLYREPGSEMFVSTRGFLIDAGRIDTGLPAADLLRIAEAGGEGIDDLPGFDTFWYTWIAVNRHSELLR